MKRESQAMDGRAFCPLWSRLSWIQPVPDDTLIEIPGIEFWIDAPFELKPEDEIGLSGARAGYRRRGRSAAPTSN